MLSSNIKIDETPAALYAMTIALAQEYVKYRKDYWDSLPHQAVNSIGSWLTGSASVKKANSKTKKEHCQEIISNITKLAVDRMGSSEELLMITIFKIGQLAREMQAEQASKKTSFSADTSLLAKLLHAQRTGLVKILRKNHLGVYEKTVKDLKNKLEGQKTILSNLYDQKVNLTEQRNEYQNLYNKLLDLQDEASIKDAYLTNQFSNDLPKIEIKEEITNVEFNLNVPVIYSPDFYNIYLRLELFVNQTRFFDYEFFYNNELKKLQNVEKSIGEISEDNLRKTPSQKNMVVQEVISDITQVNNHNEENDDSQDEHHVSLHY